MCVCVCVCVCIHIYVCVCVCVKIIKFLLNHLQKCKNHAQSHFWRIFILPV